MSHLQNKTEFMTITERDNRPMKRYKGKAKKKIHRKGKEESDFNSNSISSSQQSEQNKRREQAQEKVLKIHRFLVRQKKVEKENKSSRKRLSLNERFRLLEVTDDLKRLCPGVERKYSSYRPMTDMIYTRWERRSRSLKLQSIDSDTNLPNASPSNIDSEGQDISPSGIDSSRSNQYPVNIETNEPNTSPSDSNTNQPNRSRSTINTNLPNLYPSDTDNKRPKSKVPASNCNEVMKLPVCSTYTMYPLLGLCNVSGRGAGSNAKQINKRSASTSQKTSAKDSASRRSASTSNINKDSGSWISQTFQKGTNARKEKNVGIVGKRCHSVFSNFKVEERIPSPVFFTLCSGAPANLFSGHKKAWNKYDTQADIIKPTSKDLKPEPSSGFRSTTRGDMRPRRHHEHGPTASVWILKTS